MADRSAAGDGSGQPSTFPSGRQDVLGDVPDDLTIDLTILPGSDARKHTEAHLTQSKYILFPDGSLHGDRGRGLGFLTRPARVRTLSREAMGDLWLLLQQTGFDAHAVSPEPGAASAATTDNATPQGAFSGNPALLAPAPAEILTILSVRGAGHAATFLRRTSPDLPDPALTRVVRAVAGLAWATDVSPEGADIQPIRYDFGPDPYLRYRPVSTLPQREGIVVPPPTSNPGHSR